MIETKEQFEELLTSIEVAVNEVWDDVQYLNGGEPKESVRGLFYTTFSYWHNNKRFDIHVDNQTISVYKNGLADNTRIHKMRISENWKQELQDFLKTI